MLQRLSTDSITGEIIGGAIEVHRHFGPGMLEHTYEVCLDAQLRRRGLHVARQVPVPLRYLDVEVECAYRIDMLVEGLVVVELKVVQAIAPVHVSQMLTYLRLTNLHVGLLCNFNVEVLTAEGLRRIIRSP